jgi:hypothetical protein
MSFADAAIPLLHSGSAELVATSKAIYFTLVKPDQPLEFGLDPQGASIRPLDSGRARLGHGSWTGARVCSRPPSTATRTLKKEEKKGEEESSD